MKVIVGGCSVSNDFNQSLHIHEVYGQILANQIGADYVHHSVDAGSNHRIWKKITQMVMPNALTTRNKNQAREGAITKDDIVIIQYTHITRDEFFSVNVPNSNVPNSVRVPRGWSDECDVYDNGNIIRFKINSPQKPQRYKHQKKFFELKEKYFTSETFDKERFEYNHYLFHNTMMSKGIKVVYLVSPNRPLNNYSWDYRHLFNKNGELHLTLLEDNDEYLRHCDGSTDHYHFSKKGHKYVAIELEKFIKEKGWI